MLGTGTDESGSTLIEYKTLRFQVQSRAVELQWVHLSSKKTEFASYWGGQYRQSVPASGLSDVAGLSESGLLSPTAVKLGFKATWHIDPSWVLDGKVERCEQRGYIPIGANSSPRLMPCYPTLLRLGLRRKF